MWQTKMSTLSSRDRTIMKDYDIAVKSWPDADGWRGWEFNNSMNRYFFNDIPEPTFSKVWDILNDMQGVINLE